MQRVARQVGVATVGVLVLVSSACGSAGSGADLRPEPASGTAAPHQVSPEASTVTTSATPSSGVGATGRTTGRTTPTSDGATPPSKPTMAKTTAKPARTARPGATGRAAPLRGSGTWKRAFSDQAGAVGCHLSSAQFRAGKAARLAFGSTEVFVGFRQIGDNQDPVFARFDRGTKVYCQQHEHQPPDGRALGVTWDGGPTAYVVYTVVGGGTDLESKARSGWLSRYGDGGRSSRVTVVGQVDLGTGTLTRATFVVARLSKNNATNSLSPVAAPLVVGPNRIAVLARSAFSPLNADGTRMCNGSSEYPSPAPGSTSSVSYVGIFTADLRRLTCAQTWGCGSVKAPCPKVVDGPTGP